MNDGNRRMNLPWMQKPRKRTKPEFGYAVVDDNGLYATSLYLLCRDARDYVKRWRHLSEAKWRVVRFQIRPPSTTGA